MATEAVIVQEPVSMVEKMATEAVIIQEPISMVEKMATEAVIIAEPISMVKTEEESKHLTLEVSAGNNGVEMANVVAEGNHGIAKGESFLMSPEISKVANETCGVFDHSEVDGTPFKAEKIPDDEEKMAVRLEDEAGTRGMEKGNTFDGSEELKKQASMDSHDPTVESLKDAKETVTEASSTEQVNEDDDTKPEKLPTEAGKDQIILDSLGDTLTEKVAESKEIACVDEPEVDEKLEEVSSEEIKSTNVGNEELHSQAELPVGNEYEKPHEFSGIQPEEQGNEANGASEKKEEDSEDVSKAYQSRDSTNPEHVFTAAAAATIDLKSETSRTDEENVKEDSEDCTVETMNEKSEENTAATMSLKEVRKEHETAAAGTVKENPETKECLVANISNSAISDETVKEIVKEGESKPMKSTEEVSNSSPFNGKESKEEVIQIEVKEDHVHSSLIELEESGKDTEEETNVNEDEAEGEKNEIHNVGTVEEIGVTAEHERIGVNSANIDVDSTDSSVTCNENVEISEPQKDGMQDEIPNAGSEDHMLLTNKEIQLKEVLGEEVKEHSTVPSEEHEVTPSEERKITDETSEKDQDDPYEHLETVAVDAKVVRDTNKESPVVMEVLDEMKRDEESTVIEAENVNLVWQSEEEKSKEEIPESFQQKNEPEKEKSACPLNVVSEDVNTSTCGETVETSTNIEEATSINDREERSEGEKREETPTNHLQFEANESYETVEVDVSNETADDLHVTDSFIGQQVDNEHEKWNEFSDVQPVENEALENKEEEILQELEDCRAEKAEPKDAVENVEDNLKPEETNEVHEGPTLIVKEDCAITDNSPKSTDEDENEDTPEVEVCEKLELDKTVEIAEKQVLDEEDNKGQTTPKAETVKEKAKEENTAAMMSMTEASNSVIEEMDSIEETAKPNNDPNMLDIVKESREELTSIQGKEDHVCSSSFELEKSKNDTEEEKPASCAAETEETNIKGAEAAEEKNERDNVVVVEERGLGTTQLEGLGVYSAEMNVKSPTKKDTEIPREIDAKQDKVPNAVSEDQLEMNAEEIPSREILGYEVKEYEPDLIKEREICDEPSEKDRDLYEHSEIPLSQATDEKLMQNEDSPQSDVPKAEPEDTGNERRQEVKEHLVEEPNVEVTNVSTEEVNSEGDNQTDASEAKTLQDEKSLDLGHKTEQTEDGKPLDEATDLGETAGTYNDDEKVAKEENLAKNLEETKSLKEDSEIGKEAQIPGVVIVNDAKVEDYNTVSNEFLNEAESKEQIVEENFEVEEDSAIDGEASHVVKELEETRQGEESGDPVNVHSEDREAEKRTEEIIHDSKQWHEESCIEAVTEVKAERSLNNTDENLKALDISSVETNPEIAESDANQETEVENVDHEEISSGLDADVRTNVNDDVQKQNLNVETLDKDEETRIENPVEKSEEEEQKETKIEYAVQEDSSETKKVEEVCLSNEEETIAGQHPQNDEHEEEIQTASSTLPPEESEHGTGTINEEINYGITKEEVQTKVDAATGDEVTGEQITSLPLVSREKDENICTLEKTEEKINEADMIPDKISEDFSVVETTTELCREKQLLEPDDAKKDAAEKGEKTKEEETIKDEMEEYAEDAKTRLEICSQTERSDELEAAGEDETIAVETLAEKISNAQVLNLTTALPSKEDECESTITAEIIGSVKTPDKDASLQKEGLQEDEAHAVDDDASSQVILTEKPDKVTVATQKTSAIENLIEDNTVEAPGQASVARVESTTVIEESVVPPSFEEKAESESAPVAEDHNKETFPESSKRQDDETSIDVQNEDTEEQMKEEPKDKLEDERISNEEQNTNETEAVSLSGEVDKEVEKAESSEGIKEYIMEKESSTDEIHPVPNGEATNQVEDYSAISAECINEAKSEEQIQVENSEVQENSTDKEGLPVMKELEEGKQDKESGDPVNVHCEDIEAEEKDEAIDDLKLCHGVSHSEAVIVERAEASLNDTEVNEELVNTLNIGSVKMSLENSVSDASQETEDVEKVQFEEISSDLAPEVPTNNNDVVEVNKRDVDEFYMAKDKIVESENGLSVERVDQLNQYELVETKSEASEKSLTAEPEADKVEETEGVPETSSDHTSERVETNLKDDDSSTNTFPEEKSEEQLQSSTHTLLCEDEEITTARPIEKIEEKISNDARIKYENREDSSCSKSVEEACLLNEEQRELKTVPEEETIADKSLPNDEPEAVLESETNTPRVIAEEPEEHGATEENKIKEEESFEDENPPRSECTREIQGALEDGETAVHIHPSETSADNLHATASTVPSEVEENETTETESKEDESPKKILEQTGEIEEASNLNKETCKKPFELLSETDAAANESIARDETGGEGNKCKKTEGNEITANEDSKEEVMEDKEVTETSYSTSHSEEPMKDGYGEDETRKELKTSEIDMIETQIKDKTIEDPVQASVAEIEITEVTEEVRSQNVAIAGFEEKPKSETEPVIVYQSNETIPENTRSQDDGTSLDVPDEETEEQIKEELKDKQEDEGNINREENTNEVTKAVILSEEVDKEVEKGDGSDDIKENFMDKESSTNEIHPLWNVDEATHELEDYGAVSTECIQEAEFEAQIQAENLEVEEKKQDEKSVDPVSVHGEDREAEEKAEIIDDLKLVHGENHSEAVTEGRAETSLNDTEVNKELVNTSNISSAKMSLENTGSDANQESEEGEKVQIEEISSDLGPEIPTNNNDEVEVIKKDPNEFYTAKDQNAESENGLTVEKVDQLNQDHEIIETKSEPSNKSLTAELEANEVEEPEAAPETLSDHMSQRFETILKDYDSSTNTFPEEKPGEQLQSSTRTLLSEDEEIRTARPIEKIEEEIQNDAGIKHKFGEDSLDTKIIEEVLHQEDEALAEDSIENASAPKILSEKPEEQIQNPAVTLPSEEHKHETINEVDKTGEMKNVDFHGEDAVEEESTEKGETREPEETSEVETNTCQVIPEESEEHGTVTEENKIKVESFENEKSTQSECRRELQGALEDGTAAVHILPGETSAVTLHPAASTLPSEVRGNETKETELQEDESPEKIQEQTREIEEVSNFNIETCGIAFDNDLLTETEDAANEKKIVITNEITGIEVLNEEVMEDKEVTETSYSTSHVEEMIKDGSGEDELKDKLIQDNKLIVEAQKTSENEIIENQIEADHASISRIETIAVTEENVEPAPPGFQEKQESDLEPVDEDQSKETLPEHNKSQDDETRTDVQNRRTEEQTKEELKDKVETEGGINGEQNKNEITKAVILSEEADGSEDIKEHVIEEESSTNELHPVSKGDETTNEVEDYSAVSIESIETAESEETKEEEKVQHEEVSSDLAPEVPTNNNEEAEVMERDPEAFYMSKDQIAEAENSPTAELEADKVEIGVPEPVSDNVPPRVEETTLKVDSTSTNTFLEDKPKEQLQSSACTLFSIPNEEQRELKAVSEETIADKVLPYDEPEEQIQTTSMTFPSVEREHGTGAINEEIEYGKTKEVPINLDVVTGDEITGKKTRETNKPEEIMSSPLVSMEKEANVSSVEQIEEKSDAEIPEKISENPFDPMKAADTCLENEAIKELDDAKKDTQALEMEESKEQIFTSELPVENLNHRTEGHDEVVKEVEMLEKEGPQKPEAVIDQETIVAQASITEESQKIETISTVEMLDEEKGKETVKVKEEKCEESSAGETEELNEFHLVTKEETISYLAFSVEQLHSFSASAITSEESEHETKEKEDEKTSEGETIKYEIEDASDAKTTVEICSQKGSSVEVEAVAEDEMTADEAEKIESKKIAEAEFLQDDSGEDETLQKELLQGGEALVVENNTSSQTIPKEKPEEQIPNPVVSLLSEEHQHDTINEVEKTEEEKIKEEEMKNGDSDGVKTVEEVSTEKYQTKEVVTVFEEDESLEKIGEQTGEVEASSDINMETNEKGLNSELLDETEDAAIKENIGKATDGSGGEANLYEKINEGNEIILNEVSKEEVASHSTSQSEEPTKGGEDALKNELIEDKTYKELIVEAQKTSENEITEKQTKDGIVMNPGQASVVREETTTVTEDHIENIEITSSVVEEYVLIDLQERFVECLQKPEVRDVEETYPEVVEHGVEKTEDKLVEDSTKISSSDCVENFKETEDEKMGKVEIKKDETEEDASDMRTAVDIRSQVDTSVKLEAFTENEMTSGQILTTKKSEELQNPASAPHSKEEQCVRASIAEEIGSGKMEEEEFLQGNNEEDATFQKEQTQGGEALAVENKASLQTIPTEKSEERIPNPVVTLSSEEHKHETVNEFDKPGEENMKKEVKNRDFDRGKTVEELSTEKDEIKGDAAMSEGEINHLHITASALPSDVQGDETNKTESKENESPKNILEQTGETEEASNFTPEIHEKASDKETEDAAIKENIVKESDGFAQTNEGNDIILNEVSKEEIASYSTSHSEELTKDASQGDAVKAERIEDKTYEELIVEAQKTSEDEMNEKQIEGGLVEEQVQASIVRIETTTESSTELFVAEGKQILESIQQTGETTKTASDMQIPTELDHIEKTGITSLVAKEHVPVYLQDRVAGSLQKTEVGEIYPGGLECSGKITADCSGEEVTEESILTQDSIKISLSDNVESFAKEASQVPQDMMEGDAKDETNVSQILQADKTEKQSLVPVDAVVELKEVKTRDKSTDTKTGGEICSEMEENKDPKAVVVQETIVTRSPQIKDSVSHFEDSSQEDKHAGDETNEIFKIPTQEIQNKKPSVETQKDDANDNIRKETITEDEPVKDDMNEAPIVREEIPGKEDPNECIKTTNSTGKQQFLTEQLDEAFETSDKAVVGDLKSGTAKEIRSEAGVASGKAEMPDNSGVEKPEEPESEDSAKLSLYDLLQRSTRETIQGTKNVIEERELKVSNEEPPEEVKTDEEVEGDENSKTESGTKPHKKSHNILSGMGSKVKHSISKMKKAITGKSSHSKEQKPISPKESKK